LLGFFIRFFTKYIPTPTILPIIENLICRKGINTKIIAVSYRGPFNINENTVITKIGNTEVARYSYAPWYKK
jgi:hypothetical protein